MRDGWLGRAIWRIRDQSLTRTVVYACFCKVRKLVRKYSCTFESTFIRGSSLLLTDRYRNESTSRH